jgi:hypothetical protein
LLGWRYVSREPRLYDVTGYPGLVGWSGCLAVLMLFTNNVTELMKM